ncbi:hypothetical protein [Variovorax boronicumulans]|uniref:hypothetical protein n=1 Tax=Variovorax boronicumulans TaxID=436515 RepID=UPI003392DF04
MTIAKFDRWKELDDAYTQFSNAKNKYFKLREIAKQSIDVVEEFRFGAPGISREIAFEKVRDLPLEERKKIFPDLVAYASYAHGFTEESRNLILEFPREWVLLNIEEVAAPILKNGSHEEYSAFLDLYELISPALFDSLIQRCAMSDDQEIKEIASLRAQKIRF